MVLRTPRHCAMNACSRPERNAGPYRLAARALEGRIQAARFVDGMNDAGRAASTPLRPSRAPTLPRHRGLCGEALNRIRDRGGGPGRSSPAQHVGLPAADLAPRAMCRPTRRVLRTFVYPGPDMSCPVTALSFNACVTTVLSMASSRCARRRHAIIAAHL